MNRNDRLGNAGTLSTLERAAFGLLCLLVFSIPAEKSLELPGFGTITKLLGIVAIGAGVLATVAGNRIRVWHQIHVVMVCFIFWSGLTYVWSYSPEMTADRFVTYLQLFGLVLLIWQLCFREQEQFNLLRAYALGVCISAGDTVFRFLLAKQTYYQRYASEGFDPNDLAITCCIAIPMAYYVSLRSTGWMAWLYRSIIGLALVTVLLSASRAGTLTAIVALSLIPWTYAYLTRTEKTVLVAAVVCLGAGLTAFVPMSSWTRLASATSELSEGTLNSRTVIWKTGLDAFRETPWLGLGAGAFPAVVEPVLGVPKETRMVAHNSFLSVLTETGFVGFGTFVVLLGMLATYVYRFPELDRRFWTVMLATWAIGVSTLTWEPRKPTWLVFSLILVRGATLVPSRIAERNGSIALEAAS